MNKKKIVLLVVASAMLTTQVLAFEVNSTLKPNVKPMLTNSSSFSGETMSGKILQRQEIKKEVIGDLNEQISNLDAKTKETLGTLRIEFEKELETYRQALKDGADINEVKEKVKTVSQSFITSANEAGVNLDLATKIFEARIRVFFESQMNNGTGDFVKPMPIMQNPNFDKEAFEKVLKATREEYKAMIEKLDLEGLRTEFQMLKKKIDGSSISDSSLSDKALALEVIIGEVQRKINYKEQGTTGSGRILNATDSFNAFDVEIKKEERKEIKQERKLSKIEEQQREKIFKQLDKLSANMNAETKNKVAVKVDSIIENTKAKLEAETDLNKKKAIEKKLLLLTFVRDYFVNSTSDLNLEELLKVE